MARSPCQGAVVVARRVAVFAAGDICFFLVLVCLVDDYRFGPNIDLRIYQGPRTRAPIYHRRNQSADFVRMQ